MARTMILKEGGICQISLRVRDEHVQSLGQLRLDAGAKRAYGLLRQISMFHLLPASGADYYAEKLKDFASRQSSFDLSICPPFKFYSLNGASVSFSLASPEFCNIRSHLDEEFKDIRRLELRDDGRRNPRH